MEVQCWYEARSLVGTLAYDSSVDVPFYKHTKRITVNFYCAEFA